MEKLRNTKILGVIGNALVIVSLFCTWVLAEAKGLNVSGSVQFIEGADGKWALILSIISLIIIFAENISPTFFKGLTNIKLTLIPTVIQLIMVVDKIFKSSNTNFDGISHHFGIGFYLMCAGIIILLVFPFLYKQEKKEQ